MIQSKKAIDFLLQLKQLDIYLKIGFKYTLAPNS